METVLRGTIITSFDSDDQAPPEPPIELGVLGGLLFLLFRIVALWMLIPIAFLAWLLVHFWAQRASLPQTLCWYDSNVNAAVIKALLRLLRRPATDKMKFVGLSEMRTLETYRLFLVDWPDVGGMLS